MDKLKKIHLCLLVIIQWISLAVVILNGVALSLAKNHPQLEGHLISGSQDKLLIITGILSFLAATFPLGLHLRLSFQSSHGFVFPPTIKKVLIGELVMGVMMVTFVTASSCIVLTHFHVISNCQLELLKGDSACKIFDMAVTLGLGTIACWVILLIIVSINMTQLPIINTPEFILETNPYLISQFELKEEKKISSSSHTTVAAPPYTPSSPQFPPPSFSSVVVKPLKGNHHMIDHHSPPSSTFMDYPPDIKYPIYSIDSLPTIQSGTSKFDLSFLH